MSYQSFNHRRPMTILSVAELQKVLKLQSNSSVPSVGQHSQVSPLVKHCGLFERKCWGSPHSRTSPSCLEALAQRRIPSQRSNSLFHSRGGGCPPFEDKPHEQMLKGFPRQSVAGVPQGLSEEVSSSVYLSSNEDTPRPVVATAADLKELAFAPDGNIIPIRGQVPRRWDAGIDRLLRKPLDARFAIRYSAWSHAGSFVNSIGHKVNFK